MTTELTSEQLIDIEYNIINQRLNEEIGEPTIINVGYNIKYLSDMWDDLPHNAYINKGLTGCGGTTLAITNDEFYVIAVHSTNIIVNKSKQHKNLCPVYSSITDQDILDYLENTNIKVKKFMVTYDSVPRLLNFINCKDYRLLVDEAHILIRYLGEFKTSVCHALLELSYDFKTTSFLTATPTERSYLPGPLKQLDYIQLEWPNLCKPGIKHMYCGKQLQTKVVAFIAHQLATTDDEIYVFYNSRAGVVTAIKKLLTINKDLKLDDINIVFSNTSENISYFRNGLKNKNLDIGYKIIVDENGNPVPGHNKRVNFISSFGFEGIDFYTHGKDVTTLVVADANSKSMRYDISIDIPQILGRYRRDKVTGLFPKNDIYFIWKSVPGEFNTTYEELLRTIARSIAIGKRLLTNTALAEGDTNIATRLNKNIYSEWTPYIISEDSTKPINDQIFIPNKYALEGILSVFASLNLDYLTACNDIAIDESHIVNSLKDMASTVSTFEVPQLSASQSTLLNRKIPFSKIASEYYDLHIQLQNPMVDVKDTRDKMESLLELSDELSEYLNYVSIESMHSYAFREVAIKNLYDIQRLKYKAKDYGFVSGAIIPSNEIKSLLVKLYMDNGITKTPKKTILRDWFEINERKIVNGVFNFHFISEKF